jgi:hypothetical protein
MRDDFYIEDLFHLIIPDDSEFIILYPEMTPVVREIFAAFPVAVVFMARKKNEKLVFRQGIATVILGNVEGAFYADDDHKGIQIPALMHKIFLVQKLARGNMDKGIGIIADKVLHGFSSGLNLHVFFLFVNLRFCGFTASPGGAILCTTG